MSIFTEEYQNLFCLPLFDNNNQQPKCPPCMYSLNMPHPTGKGLPTVRCSPCTSKLTAPEKKTNSVLQWAPCSYSPYVEKVTSRYIWTNVSVLIQESMVSCCNFVHLGRMLKRAGPKFAYHPQYVTCVFRLIFCTWLC